MLELDDAERDLLDLIGAIRPRPGMYLGDNSIRLFAAFLDGYCYCRIGPRKRVLMPAFQRWIMKRYRMPKTQADWVKIIQFHSTNEWKALETFYRDFDKFVKEEVQG